MDGVGLAFTVALADVLPVHPFALVTVNVYVPPVETLMDWVVAPVDHR